MAKTFLKIEKTLYIETEDGRSGALSEGTTAYMHFVSLGHHLWCFATVLRLNPKSMVVQMEDGTEHVFFYSQLQEISDKMPAAIAQKRGGQQ